MAQANLIFAQYVEVGIRGSVYSPLDASYINRVGGAIVLEFPVKDDYAISLRGGASKGGKIHARQDLGYTGMIGVMRKVKMKNDWSLYLGLELGLLHRTMSDQRSLYFGNIEQNMFQSNLVFGIRKHVGSSIAVQVMMQPGYEYILSQESRTGAGLDYLRFNNTIYISTEVGFIFTIPSN